LIIRWVGYKLSEREQLFPYLLARCSLRQILPAKLERFLDFNPFFTQSELSLHAILQEMLYYIFNAYQYLFLTFRHNQGIQMPKYELRYRNLVQRIYGDKISELPHRRRSCSVTGLPGGSVNGSQHVAISFSDIKRSHSDEEESDQEFVSEIRQFSTQQGIYYLNSFYVSFF
jgi:hypothetical protein